MSDSTSPFWSQQRRADLDGERHPADEPVTGWEATRPVHDLRDLRTGDAAGTAPSRTAVITSDDAEHDLADDRTPDAPEGVFPDPGPSPEPSPVPDPGPDPLPSPEPPAPAPVPEPGPTPDPSPVPPPADPTGPTDPWRELSWRFVDDPRAAVDAAAELVQRAVEQEVGLTADTDTEQLRQVFTRLRDLHGRLTG